MSKIVRMLAVNLARTPGRRRLVLSAMSELPEPTLRRRQNGCRGADEAG